MRKNAFVISYPYSFRVIKYKDGKTEVIIKKYSRNARVDQPTNEWRLKLK